MNSLVGSSVRKEANKASIFLRPLHMECQREEERKEVLLQEREEEK
jgi:hypothetical protein